METVMTQLLKCSSCNKKSAFVTTKKKLERLTNIKDSNDDFFKKNEVNGFAGAGLLLSIQHIEKLIDLIQTVFNKLFGMFEDNNKKYIICRDCGYYELLK
jgi:DNA-directed RNA polymerase subunit RPC12/RpoP